MSAPAAFAGRAYVVTGGASGIGRATVLRLAEAGGSIVIADCDEAAARAVAEGLDPERIALAIGDVAGPAAADAMANVAIRRFGRLDGLVTGAGITRGIPFLDMTFEDWREIRAVNLDGTFLTCQAAARRMRGRGGAIVTLASVTADRAVTGRSAYAATKGGIVSLTRAMAIDLAPYGIRVNGVAPGAVETPLVAAQHAAAAASTRDLYVKRTPMRR